MKYYVQYEDNLYYKNKKIQLPTIPFDDIKSARAYAYKIVAANRNKVGQIRYRNGSTTNHPLDYVTIHRYSPYRTECANVSTDNPDGAPKGIYYNTWRSLEMEDEFVSFLIDKNGNLLKKYKLD